MSHVVWANSVDTESLSTSWGEFQIRVGNRSLLFDS